MIREILAKNVIIYRARMGYSQEDLSGACGELEEKDALSNRSFISDVENCRRNITLDKIELLAKALKVEPYQLFLTKDISEKL